MYLFWEALSAPGEDDFPSPPACGCGGIIRGGCGRFCKQSSVCRLIALACITNAASCYILFCLPLAQMCPVPSTVHREPICCECQAKFGGYLPVPRAKAVLPYWVPLSLRPQNQIQKMVQSYIPKTTKACPCPCHRFGGHLPMPRDQAVMPYWVPQVLRSHKKVRGRFVWQQGLRVREAPLDVRSGYNCWRICGEGCHLLKWQQLQAHHQAGPVASGQPESPPAPLLPFNLSLLTPLHALLRVMEAIR
uniref:Uncharacterized protein n=1 Tax=Moschus moschiferus TaxID=68415 RepID=A0A8C6DAV0_MOSMO